MTKSEGITEFKITCSKFVSRFELRVSDFFSHSSFVILYSVSFHCERSVSITSRNSFIGGIPCLSISSWNLRSE